jgi:hypothetical protein
MTIVYTVGRGSCWHDNELRLSIRSMVKNTPVEKIIIVGHKPQFLTNVIHIPIPDGPRKAFNIHQKTLAACEIAEEFVQAADDHFVIKETDFSEYFHGGLIKEKRYHGSYAKIAYNTKQVLPEGLFYNLHIPMKMTASKYRDIMNGYDWDTKDYLVKSLYANNIPVEGKQSSDCKVRDYMRRSTIDKYIQDRTFLSVSDAGLSEDMKRMLFEMFPTPSDYELMN